ncbi:MAG TPA: hypothetical protein DCQ39_07460 [Lachnospiraceae bacterium]|nr:hypothetical protein [Lachnospiraceae bacterium]HAP73599.1 hypothetical protein [Lachnospiraceae bacterium]
MAEVQPFKTQKGGADNVLFANGRRGPFLFILSGRKGRKPGKKGIVSTSFQHFPAASAEILPCG